MNLLVMLSFLIFSPWLLANPLLASQRSWPAGAFAKTQEPQHIVLLNDGVGAILKRLQLIESAQKSIETEFYIFVHDQVGRLYTQALVKKAKQGVRVRVLIDGLRKDNLNRYEAHVLKQAGIEVRYYNSSSLFNLKKTNHRSHRKSLIVDGREAVIGGRNMADGYFDFNLKHNVLDRDVAVSGSIVRDIQQSFENFWQSELSKDAQTMTSPKLEDHGLRSVSEYEEDSRALQNYKNELRAYHEGMKKAQSLVVPTVEDHENEKRVKLYGEKALEVAPTTLCHESYFYADLPGASKSSRVVYDQIRGLFQTAQKTLSVESPFFMQIEKEDPFHAAIDRGIQVEVLSNSLHTTEVLLTVAPFMKSAKSLAARGAQVWVTDGTSMRWVDTSHPNAKAGLWGTHAKTVVLDRETTLIGSFNMDPRSAVWNSELAFVCRKNTELAEAVLLDIERRRSISVKLDAQGNPVDGREKYFDVNAAKRLKYLLLTPVSHLLEFLL